VVAAAAVQVEVEAAVEVEVVGPVVEVEVEVVDLEGAAVVEACLSILGAGKPDRAMPSHVRKPGPCAARQDSLLGLRRARDRRPRRSTRGGGLSNPILRMG
jgi:hypothetical protein